MALTFGPRRAFYLEIDKEMKAEESSLSIEQAKSLEIYDLVYRSLCAILYNYVPTSGHPGGSISSGRIVQSLLFHTMEYDVGDPDRSDADIISYAAGHKAMGLYALWALRDEILRIGAPGLQPEDITFRLRLEDLLGFRRNPITNTPLFKKFRSKPLDGHPTPATPFVRLATGASGVGVASSIGLAFGAKDIYRAEAPRVHIIEGEGGLTPGRVSEALAAAGTACLANIVLHLDWNQASIDSDRVCREGKIPGDYVQWSPMELFYLHDWNVIFVPDGSDFRQISAAQTRASQIKNQQPTVIVYKTIKGWQYGVQGKASHGAGHGLCSKGFFEAVKPLQSLAPVSFPRCAEEDRRCQGPERDRTMEECLWEAIQAVRKVLEGQPAAVQELAQRLKLARERLNRKKRKARQGGPYIDRIYEASASKPPVPEELSLKPGETTTLRGELGRILGWYNRISEGALLVASADLLGSTSVSAAAEGFPKGYFNGVTNPDARILSLGGICEDAMAGILTGISTYGYHIGVASSYGAFIAPLGHIASRLHAIGGQARQSHLKVPLNPFILICAHAGIKTGEDGPTHADPQALQLLQENFPRGTMITLTPWDPQEMWFLVTAALAARPAVIAPFVTRPTEKILDRSVIGLAPEGDAKTGLYLLRGASGKGDGTLILQGSEVAYAFILEALPLLEKEGIDLNVFYVASVELFDMLHPSEQERIFPQTLAREAMGITGFTLPTMHRFIQSDRGRAMSLYPFKKGHYLGSGQAEMVLAEAGLDGESQYKAIVRYIKG